jgi:hypothetical protein
VIELCKGVGHEYNDSYNSSSMRFDKEMAREGILRDATPMIVSEENNLKWQGMGF